MMVQTRSAAIGVLAALLAASSDLHAGQAARAGAPTFSRDVAPILQRSCQTCHRPDSIAPMPLITYEEVRPYARAIKQRTGLRDKRGVMPPWFIEKDLGIRKFKDDISLTDEEIATIAKWADTGAPQGNPADMPPPRTWADAGAWQIGTPDLVVETPVVPMKAISPDWWGALAPAATGLTEDRYIAAVEIKEQNDSRKKEGRATVGGLFVFHHAVMAVMTSDGRADFGGWPVHEVGRNADIFNPDAGRLLRAGSQIVFPSVHLHANGKDTNARLQIGFKFHPKGYQPKLREQIMNIGTGDIDLRGMEANQRIDAYQTLTQPMKLTVFEPHMHAAGVRMCVEAIYGSLVETLNCAGYDHSWVKTYQYADDAAPLLPRGTILHVIAYFDNTPANRNVVDPRNWSGLGHRSIDNMVILLAQGLTLTDDQFAREVSQRRERLQLREGQTVVGCPLCGFATLPGRPAAAPAVQQ
jgi:hypothetical protein